MKKMLRDMLKTIDLIIEINNLLPEVTNEEKRKYKTLRNNIRKKLKEK